MQTIILDSQLKIYVPSTVNINQKIDKTKIKKIVNNVLSQLSGMFGGATSFDAVGAWQSEKEGLILENITICQAFCSKEALQDNLQTVKKICKELKITLNQEAVSLEINNQLLFI